MLQRLRALRDQQPWGEVRQAFNAACDRLDVLASKLYTESKAPGVNRWCHECGVNVTKPCQWEDCPVGSTHGVNLPDGGQR